MSNVSIFKQPGAVAATRRESALAKTIDVGGTARRIATNTNGTFRRLIGGEQVGKAIRGEFNAIIVDALPKVSRVFYAGKYDPDAKPTLPDCWSNNGDVPDKQSSNPQAANCASCAQNIVGSGENGKGRACRYQRRVALLLDGDPSGDAYQFNIPAKSLFGKGSGNTHPFESYVKFLLANGEAPDTVVTNIAYNLEAETMELVFSAVRQITDDEYALVQAAQADPATRSLIVLTVAQADGVSAKPAQEKKAIFKEQSAKPQPVQSSDEPDDAEEDAAPWVAEAPAEPVRRSRTAKDTVEVEPAKPQEKLAAVLNDWGLDE